MESGGLRSFRLITIMFMFSCEISPVNVVPFIYTAHVRGCLADQTDEFSLTSPVHTQCLMSSIRFGVFLFYFVLLDSFFVLFKSHQE